MIAFLDTPSGISGDMFLGCLVDAGWPVEALRATVDKLGLPADRWGIDQQQVMRGPLAATLVLVDAAEDTQHRHLPDVEGIIQKADLPEAVKRRAVAVFQRLAEAEAGVHGSSVNDVHFHEVGALDAIIDIVGVCAGLHALGIEQLYAGGLPLGEGWTRSAHGRIPLPAPATLALLSAVNAPSRPAPGPGELVTPTGAALLAELAEFRQPPMRLGRIGLGAGRKEFDWPNIARLWLAEAAQPGTGAQPAAQTPAVETGGAHEPASQSLRVLETNIDDMNPELYAPVMAQLMAQGARDVWLTPIQMKKGRPGMLISVLCTADQKAGLVERLLRETTTLGVRVYPVTRYAAGRAFERVETAYGPVRVKIKELDGRVVGVKPEYEECLRLAQSADVPLRRVYEAALAAGQALYPTEETPAEETPDSPQEPYPPETSPAGTMEDGRTTEPL